jgi:hypothetical protein
MAKPRAKPIPPGGENHPSRRRKIPPSKEVQQQTEKNYDPKTGKHKGSLNQPRNPRPGRPIIPMPPPPGGEMWNTVITRRNKDLWGFLK